MDINVIYSTFTNVFLSRFLTFFILY